MTPKNLATFLTQKLTDRSKQDALRFPGLDSSHLVDFSSNDYLGLARSEELALAIRNKEASMSRRQKNGSTGSRLLTGNSPYTEMVESKLASIFKAEACLLFNSGYTANLAVLSTLPQKDDTILYDERAHACIKDGARLSLAKRLKFRHNDLHDLEAKLMRSSGRKFVIVESTYSMDGDTCPVKDLLDLCQKYDVNIVIDEAHSTGVTGALGAGLIVSLGLEDFLAARLYTFGKAMGVHGACVVGSKKMIDYLINFSRPFIYTTALPPHSVIAIDCAFDYLSQHSELQESLQKKVSLYNKCISTDIPASGNNSPIQTIITKGNNRTKEAAHFLRQNGFDVRPILAPTIPAGTERLRICLHTFNEDQEILVLTSAINEFVLNV